MARMKRAPKLASQAKLAMSADQWEKAGRPHLWIAESRIEYEHLKVCICADYDVAFGLVRIYALKVGTDQLRSDVETSEDMVTLNEWFGKFIYLGPAYGDAKGLYEKKGELGLCPGKEIL